MEELKNVGFEVREESMISPTGGGKPIKRLAHFIQPSINSIDASVFELPSHCLSSLPATFEPKKWPLNVNFHGWRSPQRDWNMWFGKMAAFHESTWRKAGIHDAILNSTYEIRRNYDLVLGIAEKWCPETNSFVFPWGEATITLEDVMISGYSVLGYPIFIKLETDGLKETEEKLNQARTELVRSATRKPRHTMWMKKFMDSGSEIEHEAFLVLWLSRFVFPSSFDVIVRSVFPIAVRLARGITAALAPAILASIYRDLSLLKKKIVVLPEMDNLEDKDSRLEVTIRSPFQLVQIWAWERFTELRPNPNLIKNGEARFARWHNIMIGVDNVRMVLDSAKKKFDWRPYTKTVQNWKLPKFYGEKEIWISIDTGLSEELQSFARCLRISELIDVDCIQQQYLPHRVAMQFGMDQDLPACVHQANESPYIAWSCYIKPINYINLCIPSRFYEAAVTTQYLEWWKQSLLHMQSANKGALPQKRSIGSSKTIPKTSKAGKEVNFTAEKKAKGMKDGDISSGCKKTPNKLEEAKQRNFITCFKTKPKRFDGIEKGNAASIPPGFSLKSSELSSDISKWNKRETLKCSLKKANKFFETSKEKKEVNYVSSSAEFPSKMSSPSLAVKNEADDSPVPPGFPPKSNLVAASDSTEEDVDNFTIAEVLKSRKMHHGFWIGKVGNDENLRGQSETSSSIAECKGFKMIEPKTELVGKIMQNEPMNFGSETAMKGSTDSKAGSPAHDMVRIQGGEDGNKYERDANETPALQLEDQVTRLERIIAKLKAARFGHERAALALE